MCIRQEGGSFPGIRTALVAAGGKFIEENGGGPGVPLEAFRDLRPVQRSDASPGMNRDKLAVTSRMGLITVRFYEQSDTMQGLTWALRRDRLASVEFTDGDAPGIRVRSRK